MGSGGAATAAAPPSSSSDDDFDPAISELAKQHRKDLEGLTLLSRPFKTLQLFTFAALQYLKGLAVYVLRRGAWFMVLSILVLAFVILVSIDGSHDEDVQEILAYTRFVLWWVALGVASSIGLGLQESYEEELMRYMVWSYSEKEGQDFLSYFKKDLVCTRSFLYLGPHIALFTIKAMQCGRVDLKTAPYDTIQLKRGPSWLDKDCSDFGPPIFPYLPGSRARIPFSNLLPQVELEAVLWGIGTAVGELPPYFISRAARLSGSSLDAIEIDAACSKEDGFLDRLLKQVKWWLLAHSQHLSFSAILVLASVPNPLFDLAGIMCGQFGISFWKFFLATLIGKALIKTHIQTAFIISVCNNQLLELVEHKMIWILGLIPGFSSVLPHLVSKLQMAKEKYLSAPLQDPSPSNAKGKQWGLSFTLIWNTIVWLMLLHFFAKIVTSAAQMYLKKQQDLELANKRSALRQTRTESD